MKINGWTIDVVKSSIMTSQEMDVFAKSHDMPSLPEMIHGKSLVRCVRGPVGVCFSPLEALLEWRKHCFHRTGPRVASAKAWTGALLATAKRPSCFLNL